VRATSTICDCCHTTDAVLLFTATDRRFGGPGSFGVVRCSTCRLVRTDPWPDDLSEYYPASYYSFTAPTAPTERVVARAARLTQGGSSADRLLRPLDERLLPGMPRGEPGTVLDVGCGSGEALLVLQAIGWQCTGIEIDGAAVAAAHEAGLPDVQEGDLAGVDLAGRRFEIVRFWHSLEHTRSPRAQLRVARRLLRPGGRLLVGVPSFASLLARRLRDRSFYLDVPRHLWHFEPDTLRAVVEAEGFEVESVRLRSGSEPLLRSVESLLPATRRLLGGRLAWRATLPLAALLDVVGRGDALELVATPLDE
jgi:SAM-dependent methyltransferase